MKNEKCMHIYEIFFSLKFILNIIDYLANITATYHGVYYYTQVKCTTVAQRMEGENVVCFLYVSYIKSEVVCYKNK